MELQIISSVGYEALENLAESEPKLFTQGDTNKLRQRMETAARDENGPDVELYVERLDIRVSLEELNRLQQSGPSSDAEYVPTMRRAIGSSVVQAANPLLWATLNCFELPQYVPVRWRSNNLPQATENFVRRHWLQYSGPDGRESNAAARLWWLGEMATRAAEHSKHSYGDLLLAMTGNVNLYHQANDRSFLFSNTRLIAAVYDVFLDGNEHLKTTKDASALMMRLNLRAATLSFDFLDYDELRSVVEEAKPPKGP